MLYGTLLTAVILSVSACRNSGSNGNGGDTDSLRLVAMETVRLVAITGDVERTEELIDSFSDLKRLTPIMADFYRAVVYGNKGDMETHQKYLGKILEDYDMPGEKTNKRHHHLWKSRPHPCQLLSGEQQI